MTYAEHQLLDVIRFLLRPDTSRAAIVAAIPASDLVGLARKNVVIRRLVRELQAQDIALDAGLSEACRAEAERVETTVRAITEIAAVCTDAGLSFIFTKALQHYPDMGHDIDLVVADGTRSIDELLIRRFDAVRARTGVFDRIAGKTGYALPGSPSPVEIHHGRLGHLGEHRNYLATVIVRRRSAVINGVQIWIPSNEDQLIIQALQRVFGHLTLRASDVLRTLVIINASDFDSAYVERTAAECGVLYGLRSYLAAVRQLSRMVDALWPARLNDGAPTRVRTAVVFGEGQYRLRRAPTAIAYGRAFGHAIRRARWDTAGRIGLLPGAAVIMGVDRARRALKALR